MKSYHFGSTDAVDSYMFDKLKRAGNSDELKRWIKQIKFISEYDMSLADEINLIIFQLKKNIVNICKGFNLK